MDEEQDQKEKKIKKGMEKKNKYNLLPKLV